jgi:hypothetical protein
MLTWGLINGILASATGTDLCLFYGVSISTGLPVCPKISIVSFDMRLTKFMGPVGVPFTSYWLSHNLHRCPKLPTWDKVYWLKVGIYLGSSTRARFLISDTGRMCYMSPLISLMTRSPTHSPLLLQVIPFYHK